MPNYISNGHWMELTPAEVVTLGTNPTPAAVQSLKATVISAGRKHKRD